MTQKEEFIRVLADYLAGPNQAMMSIRLQMNKSDAVVWARLRSATPLFGYPTVQEAEEILTKFLSQLT